MRLPWGILSALMLLPLSAHETRAQNNVNILCSVQAEWCQALAAAFEKGSGIRVAVSMKGSGESLAQLRAEKDNPKTDLWFGGTGDPHLIAAEEGLSEPFDSPVLKDLHPWAVEQWRSAGQRAVGIYAGALGFGFNKEWMAKKRVEAPKCWSDLLKADFKGEIQMANPNSSSTSWRMPRAQQLPNVGRNALSSCSIELTPTRSCWSATSAETSGLQYCGRPAVVCPSGW